MDSHVIFRFANIQAIKLQRIYKVDLAVVRNKQPLIDKNLNIDLKLEEKQHLCNNRKQFTQIYKKVVFAIIKSIQNSGIPIPAQKEVTDFAYYMIKIASLPGFPFYGNRFNSFIESSKNRLPAFPSFSSYENHEVENFLLEFRQRLNKILIEAASIADFKDTQEAHVVFHAVHAISLVFDYYLISSRKYGPLLTYSANKDIDGR
ncbi:MAG: hypothetical protein N3G80_01965 [Candidatus Micrarchaeota archaeon]|nr:hypothetical protein [Candidatus Micrarchaeota archaeon]